jgi:hypothetical protein
VITVLNHGPAFAPRRAMHGAFAVGIGDDFFVSCSEVFTPDSMQNIPWTVLGTPLGMLDAR